MPSQENPKNDSLTDEQKEFAEKHLKKESVPKTEEKEDSVPKEEPKETKVENVIAERLANKEKELQALEKRIDAKIAGFKKFVEDTATHGKSETSVEMSEEEKKETEAKKLIAGTGLEDVAFPKKE